jgi:hypothetical protein
MSKSVGEIHFHTGRDKSKLVGMVWSKLGQELDLEMMVQLLSPGLKAVREGFRYYCC